MCLILLLIKKIIVDIQLCFKFVNLIIIDAEENYE